MLQLLLSELESLSRSESAKVVITIEDGFPRASYKVEGRTAEVVQSFRNRDGLVDVLRELVHRLTLRDVPTTENIVKWMTPTQRRRVWELCSEIRAIKAEAMRPLDEVEPRLAPPRSSLNPKYFTAEHAVDFDERRA